MNIFIIVDKKSGKYLMRNGDEYCLVAGVGLFFVDEVEANIELTSVGKWDLEVRTFKEQLNKRPLINGDKVAVYNCFGLEVGRGTLIRLSPELLIQLDDGGFIGIADRRKVKHLL